EHTGLVVRRQQGFHFGDELGIAFRFALEKRGTLGHRRVERNGEQRLDLQPAFARDVGGHVDAASSRCSQARAMSLSRLTDATEIPTTIAVSSSVRPPK